ncbi:hypothetical protein TNCV_5140931 [Trichonephila clavipes]|nr:hypothetical protein TNCV_5140931 [Trichonephila clavipes]
MAPHKPKMLVPTEYTTDEEDMIMYDVEENELEPNPYRYSTPLPVSRWIGEQSIHICFGELLLLLVSLMTLVAAQVKLTTLIAASKESDDLGWCVKWV